MTFETRDMHRRIHREVPLALRKNISSMQAGAPTIPASSKIYLYIVDVPASSSSPGEVGMVAISPDYFYIYTGDGATHSWLRIAGANEF